MKKRFSVVALAAFILIGLATFSFGQVPDISGDWLFDLSGNFQGGALITVTASGDMQGYGLGVESGGKDGNGVLFSGHLDVDEKGKITGTYAVNSIEDGFPSLGGGNIAGKVDKKISKLSLKFEDGPTGKAIKLPSDPVMPSSWAATAKGGKAVLDLTVDPLTHQDDLNLDFPHRMYSMTGPGITEDNLDIYIDGGFFLTSKSKAYGWYNVYDNTDPLNQVLIEEGFFFGKVNLTPGRSSFSFKLTGYDPEDQSMSKGVLKGTAN
jgi:hypothetical protein